MLWRLDYTAHPLHYGVAERRAEIWRTVVAVVAMAFLYIGLSLVYQQLVFGLVEAAPALADEIGSGATPRAMYLILLNFAVITAAVMLVTRMVHDRSALGVIGAPRLAVAQFLRVSRNLIILSLCVIALPPYGMSGDLVPNLAPGKWALLLPASLVAVFIQISAEEILFRGYLQQQLAARFRSPLAWMVVPSLLFAIGHYQPAEAGQNAWPIVLWAAVFGMLMADLTARAGSLGPALAVHFANNVIALLVTSLPDALGGLALFHTPFGMADEAILRAWLPVDFVMMLCMWLAARLALRR